MKGTRLTVLADEGGRLLAAWIPEAQTDEAAPQVLLTAGEGQIVVEVEPPSELYDAPLQPELLERYRLKHCGKSLELVRKRASQG